jgi:alpha-beta hydrolase superfamily lysophospholipase
MIEAGSPPRDVSIASADGTALRGWHWTRPGPRGVVVIAHGFGEHGGCYGEVAERLGSSLDVDVVAPDLRGHGRSPGRRGVTRRYDDLVADVRAALAWSARERPGLPVFLLGHSNGGLLALRLAADRPAGAIPAALIVSNPAIRIVTPIPRAKLMFGRVLLRYAPWFTLAGKLEPDLMTRDPAKQREHLTDPLRHGRISPPFFFGMAAAGLHVAEHAGAIARPTLMLLGGSDPVIDPDFSRQVFDRLGSPDKDLRLYPEMRHEPLNELGRERVFTDIEDWMRPRLA